MLGDVKNKELPPVLGDIYPPSLAGTVFTDADNDWGTGTTSSTTPNKTKTATRSVIIVVVDFGVAGALQGR